MKIARTGHFLDGEMVGGWAFEGGEEGRAWVSNPPNPTDIFYLPPDGRVLVNGVEIEPWTKARKDSGGKKKRGWVKV